MISSLFSNYNDVQLSLTDFFKRYSESYLINLRLFGRMCCSLECFFISLIYIRRFHESNRGVICSTSIKNVITASYLFLLEFIIELFWLRSFSMRFVTSPNSMVVLPI